jgi:DNA polymerase I
MELFPLRERRAVRPLYVFDITSILFRLYCAGVRHETPQGVEVGGVIGIAMSLRKHFKRLKPTHIAAVFDSGAPTFRQELAEEYKQNRPKAPDELKPQFALAIELVESLGITVFKKDGYEADDLMASLTSCARAQGIPVHLISNDKDLHQLIDDDAPSVVQHSLDGKKLFRSQEVWEKFGVYPEQMIDYQALVGDSVDEIAGVPGIGKKTASALLQHFKTLHSLYADIEQVRTLNIRGALRVERSLVEHREELKRALSLVRLVPDIEFFWDEQPIFDAPNTTDEHRQPGGLRAMDVQLDLHWKEPSRAALGFLSTLGRKDLFWSIKDAMS